MNIVSTDHLSRRYGRRIGIESVDLQISKGELFGFLGPNGAGKTTTIRILLGMLRPSAGTAQIFGYDCWKQSPRIRRDLGYLPGDLRLYSWLTAESALRLVGKVRGEDLLQYGNELLDRFGLARGVPVRSMSRGMRQKLGLVLALAHKPRLVVLDEPTSGLDPLVRDALAMHLQELAADGHTVFFSSHTLSEVEQLCHRVAVVRAGKIVACEKLAEMRRRTRRSVTLEFRDAATAAQTAAPSFLDVRRRSGQTWHCELSGEAPELIRWAATQPLSDITIGSPSLEGLFRSFYESSEESS